MNSALKYAHGGSKGIPGIGAEASKQLLDLFNHEDGISKVILYGSRAKGTYRPGSDIDLTVMGEGLTTDWLLSICGKIDDLPIPYEVDISIYDHIENKELLEHIKRVGMEVFNNERGK